jgi:CRP-like cAMP-binding protein
MEELIALLDSYGALEQPLETYLRSVITTTHHRKGDFLVRPGDIAQRISFIEEGIIRGYRIKRGVERTYYFMMKGDVFISVRSFFTQTPAKEYIECMENCILHSISFQELRDACKKYPSFNLHRAELLLKYYLLSIEREDMHQLRTYDRVCYLMENQPGLVEKIEDQYLASYLSMGTSTFSRHKGKYNGRR